jgi:hypothetical protein
VFAEDTHYTVIDNTMEEARYGFKFLGVGLAFCLFEIVRFLRLAFLLLFVSCFLFFAMVVLVGCVRESIFWNRLEWILLVWSGGTKCEENKWLLHACKKDNLEEVQWLVSFKTKYDKKDVDLWQAFEIACTYGALRVAKWIVSVQPTIAVDARQKKEKRKVVARAFRSVLSWGHTDCAQWLYDTFNNMRVTSNLDSAFLMCVVFSDNGARWFQKVKPSRYHINVCDGGFLEGSIVRPLKFYARKVKVSGKEDCAICQDAVSNVQTKCGHQFCEICLTRWIRDYKRICPYCREPITCKVHRIEG